MEGTHPLNKVKNGPCQIEGLDNNLIQHVAYKIAKNLDLDGILKWILCTQELIINYMQLKLIQDQTELDI